MKTFSPPFILLLGSAFFYLLASGCHFPDNHRKPDIPAAAAGWRAVLNHELPLLGHRNWILVVDKAFPQENVPGMKTIYTGEDMLTVLRYTLKQVNSSGNVRPVIYTDRELQYVQPEYAPGINAYRKSLKNVLGSQTPLVMLHDSVFTRIAAASRLFRILVLKTTDTIAYTSVYLQLGCAYWSDQAEKALRDSIRASVALKNTSSGANHR